MLPSSPWGFCMVKVCVIVSSFTIYVAFFPRTSAWFWWGTSSHLEIYARKPLAYLNNAQIWPVKVSTLLVLSKSCRFFQHPYHFHPCSDYLAEGPSTGKNFGSVRMKFGTDRLFTLQILSEPNPFFWDPCHFHPSHAKNFLKCKPPFQNYSFEFKTKAANKKFFLHALL